MIGNCGCIRVKTKEENKRIYQPGEKGIIVVSYDVNRVGKFEKTISVYTNSSNEPIY